MHCVFIFLAVMVAQLPATDEPVAAPPPDWPTEPSQIPEPQPEPAPTTSSPAPLAAPAPEIVVAHNWFATGVTAGCLAAGAPAAWLLGATTLVPLAFLAAFYWVRLTSPNKAPGYLRWYDALQAVPGLLSILFVGTCIAAPLGVPLSLGSGVLGVLIRNKPSVAGMRAGAVAALPGAAWAVTTGAVVLGGVVSATVLVASLLVFWMTYAPALGPLSLLSPRLWHQVNNVACCCIGVSLITTPLLLLAWPVSLLGVVGASGWTAWRAGEARAALEAAP